MKGIVLAGGTGSRLWPITLSISKQLLPVYDKPMIYYPISTLMLAGVRDFLIITTPIDLHLFRNLLGDGSQLGVKFSYQIQDHPRGLADAFIIGEEFLQGQACLMILGDNIFHGYDLEKNIMSELPTNGAHIFTYEVQNPNSYGVLEVDENQRPLSVHEKPKHFISNLAVTGLYYFDGKVTSFANATTPSARGELEITSIINSYIAKGQLTFTKLSRGSAWLDTGNPDSLSDASEYIRIMEKRTGVKIGCLEEIAFSKCWIDLDQLRDSAKLYNNDYGEYLGRIQ